MILKDIVNLLANRINQLHVIECYLRKVYAEGYKTGTKQSPWISVKDRLPPNMKKVLVRCEFEREIIYGIDFMIDGKWKCRNGISTHWMPIPSFDWMLEANRDVLERIKEKGD